MRVLVMDDHEVFRAALSDLLDSHGHDVVGSTADAEGAMELVERVPADVFFVDWLSPSGNNGDLVRALRQTRPDLPIVVMSMDHVPTDEVLASGAAAVVAKEQLVDIDLSSLLEQFAAGAESRR